MNWYLISIFDIDECLWPIDKDIKKTVLEIGNAYFEDVYNVRLISTDVFPTFAYFIVECTEEYTEAFREELRKHYNADCNIKLFRKMED